MESYRQFPSAILHLGVCSIALLTLSPLALAGTFDLHVLAMPPAFNLSHDQTLQLISVGPEPRGSGTYSKEERPGSTRRHSTARADVVRVVATDSELAKLNRSTSSGLLDVLADIQLLRVPLKSTREYQTE